MQCSPYCDVTIVQCKQTAFIHVLRTMMRYRIINDKEPDDTCQSSIYTLQSATVGRKYARVTPFTECMSKLYKSHISSSSRKIASFFSNMVRLTTSEIGISTLDWFKASSEAYDMTKFLPSANAAMVITFSRICLSVCNTLTFESRDLQSSFLVL